MKRLYRLRELFRTTYSEQGIKADLDAELEFHFERTVEDLVSSGMSPEAARDEASRRFGDVSQYRGVLESIDRKRVAKERRTQWLEIIRHNVAYAFRGMRRSPGFTLSVVLTLALGIGANATMFGVIDRLLLRPPAHVKRADQVRRLFVNRSFMGRSVTNSTITYPDYVDFQASQSFEVAGYYSGTLTLGWGAEATRVQAILATASLFPILDVNPAQGRFFVADEDKVGAAGTAVLSYSFWQRRFGGDLEVLGRVLHMGNGSYTVVGVAPQGFTGADLARVDVWLPLRTAAAEVHATDRWQRSRGSYWIRAILRLHAGVTTEGAEAEATAIHRRARADDPRYDPNASITAASLIAARGPGASNETVVARWLAGVSFIVLVIVCANVANLLLARGVRLRGEIAIRLALGVSRARLVGQLITESVLLAGLGGAAALFVASWGGNLMRGVLVPHVSWPESPVGTRVLMFTLAVSLVTGLLAGLVPALRASRLDLTDTLKQGGRGTSLRRSRTRTALLVAQGALSVVLLVGAGLFVRSLNGIQSLDLGLDPDGIVVVNLEVSRDAMRPDRLQELYTQALERVRSIPGVRHVAASMSMPFWTSFADRLRVPGIDSLPIPSTGGPYINHVTHEYFTTMGMRILRGRGFTTADAEGAQRVAVVEETMARLLWPGEDALGKCLLIGSGDPPCAEVVGILADSRRQRVVEDDIMQYFVPLEQRILGESAHALYVKSAADPQQLAGVLRRQIQALAPDVKFVQVRQLREFIDPQQRSWKLGATMFTVFGVLALVVSGIGLYSVLAFNVAQRTHEIGVRAALGASSNRLISLVVKDAMRLAAIGIVLGGLMALAAGRAVEPLLFEVSPHDPAVYGVVTMTLLIVAMLASSIPAWRATRVDLRVALRAE